ncbi:hypothetical protein [Luedemannella helvata]|uniref:Uncharacterized protein n=1 Tax=Luedemannella helvata TaxID=349315 RepID=A0ABP4W101_9ACTN
MADAWLHKTVDVDINGVLDFANRVITVQEDFAKSLGEGVTPMMKVKPAFGGGVVKEGAYFRGMHDNQVRAAMAMINDVVRGLAALSKASAGVAVEYLNGDAESQANVDDVYNAFTPSPPKADEQPTTTTAAGSDVPYDEDPPDIPAYVPTPHAPGSGEIIAPGAAGQYVIGADDEKMNEDVADVPRPDR